MAEFPALPLWTDAYLADTSHLDDAERGRYDLILFHLWRAPNQRFPNDDGWLARKFGRPIERVITEIRPLISEFCHCDGNWIRQKRLDKEWTYVQKQSRQRSDAAKSRWNKEKGTFERNTAPHASRNAPTPTPTPTPKERKKSVSSGVGPASAAEPGNLAGHTQSPMSEAGFNAWVQACKSTIPKGWSPPQALRRWLQLPTTEPQLMIDAWDAYITNNRAESTKAKFPKRTHYPENWFKDRIFAPFLESAEEARQQQDQRAQARTATIAQWENQGAAAITAIGEAKFDAWLLGSTYRTIEPHHAFLHIPKEFSAKYLRDNPSLIRSLENHLNVALDVVTGPLPAKAATG